MALQCAFAVKILEMFLMYQVSILLSSPSRGWLSVKGARMREVEFLLAKNYCPLTDSRPCDKLLLWCSLMLHPAQRRASFSPCRSARRKRSERARERSNSGAQCAPRGVATARTNDRPSAPGTTIFPAAVKAATFFIAPEQRRDFSGAGCDARRRRMLAGGGKIKRLPCAPCPFAK